MRPLRCPVKIGKFVVAVHTKSVCMIFIRKKKVFVVATLIKGFVEDFYIF